MLLKNVRTVCLSLLIILGFGLAGEPRGIRAGKGLAAQKNLVFVVGTLNGSTLTCQFFPANNRRDAQLVDFSGRQGVPGDQLVYLRTPQATTRRVKSIFRRLPVPAREGDLLFFILWTRVKSDDERTT